MMKKLFLFLALAGGHVVWTLTKPTRSRQYEDPPHNSAIIDENKPSIDPSVIEDFHENFATWRQLPVPSIEGLLKPIGFELGKTSGGTEIVQILLLTLDANRA